MCEVKCSQSVISSLKYIRTFRTLNVQQINPIFISKEIVVYECYCKRKRLSAVAKILFASLHFNSQLWRSLMETQCGSHHEEELLRGILCRYYRFSRFSSLHYEAWKLQSCMMCLYLRSCWICKSLPLFYTLLSKEVLAEIPDQLLSVMTKHYIKPKPRQPLVIDSIKPIMPHSTINKTTPFGSQQSPPVLIQPVMGLPTCHLLNSCRVDIE